MMSLILSLALEGGTMMSPPGIGTVTGPDAGRPLAAQVAPDPAAMAPGAAPDGADPMPSFTPPERARQAAQAAKRAQDQFPGAKVLSVEPRDGAHHVRLIRNGQVRVVVVPQP